MFVTQREACKRLNITHPTFNRLREDGLLPDTYPGLKLFWWPALVVFATRKAGLDIKDCAEPVMPAGYLQSLG